MSKQDCPISDSVEYDSPSSCNSCGALANTIIIIDSVESIICECTTECKQCGFKDHWSYGFFESRMEGLNNAKRYAQANTVVETSITCVFQFTKPKD